tara:strand:+ start:415 stop:600 length:186 start_codon:yes stop_codon:yes gene_type:complete
MNPRLPQKGNDKIPSQRKTTLKWNSNGELTSVDMARVLDRLSNPELTKCELPKNIEQNDSI